MFIVDQDDFIFYPAIRVPYSTSSNEKPDLTRQWRTCCAVYLGLVREPPFIAVPVVVISI